MTKSIVSMRPVFVFLMIFLGACAPASTPVPPTLTPLPPTTTPAPPTKAAPTSTATALPPVTFTSSRFGYSISVPAGWTMQEGHREWLGVREEMLSDPGADLFHLSVNEEFPPLQIGILHVKPETTLESWAQSQASPPTFFDCTSDPAMQSLTVAGEPALMQSAGCIAHSHTNVFLIHDDLGIVVAWITRPSTASLYSFTSILDSMKFP